MCPVKTFDIQEDDLYSMFIEKNMTRRQIASVYGCSEFLIKAKCRQYGIKKPKHLEALAKQRQVDKRCQHCSNTFKTVPFRVSGKYESKFCSPECSQQSRNLGATHRTKMRTSRSAKRRALFIKACVELTEEEARQIKEMYLNCPVGYEVDHIVPISKGGKHHPSNLQYLTVFENRRKRDRVP